MTVIEIVIQDHDRTTTVRIKPLETSTINMIDKVDDGNDNDISIPLSATNKETIFSSALSPSSHNSNSDAEQHKNVNKSESNFLTNLFKNIGSLCSSSSST